MSLTLRDAQHLSWKTFNKLGLLKGKPMKPEAQFEETAKAVADLLRRGSGAKGQRFLGRVLSELLYVAFVLAEQNGVGLEEAFLETMDSFILDSV